GVELVKALRTSRKYLPVCFLDDDIGLHGNHVAGLKVHHAHDLQGLLRSLHIEQVIIAIPSVLPETCRRVVSQLKGSGVTVKTLPSLAEIVEGRISEQSIREIKLE